MEGAASGRTATAILRTAYVSTRPTWWGFSVSSGFYDDDVKDIALKYAADWNSIKVSAAAGFTNTTDEGCSSPGTPGGNGNGPGATCGSPASAHLNLGGGGGAPFQNFRRDVDLFQVGASIMHVPSGLFAYGLYQHEENNGTQFGHFNFNTNDSCRGVTPTTTTFGT